MSPNMSAVGAEIPAPRIRRRSIRLILAGLASLAIATSALIPTTAASAATGFVQPVTGHVAHVVGGCPADTRPNHEGVDINNNAGAPIYAAAGGTVTTAINSNATTGYGTQIVITHADGYTTRYAHLVYGSMTVSQGATVAQGDRIGTVGSTGNSTGPHLHFEIKRNGSNITNSYYYCGQPNVIALQPLGAGPSTPPTANSFVKFDINGDAKADLLGIRSDGYLVEFFGNGSGGTQSTYVAGPGWGTTAALVTGDFNGDGAGDIMQTRTDGSLYFYQGNYASIFTPTYLGPGWASYSLVTGGVDFNSDGRADLVARGPDTNLYLYPGNGQGSFGNPVQIGTNWSSFTALIAGDFNRDGRGDLIARNGAGELWGYYGTPNGLGLVQQVGQGWNGFSTIISNGDHNGDQKPDLIARRASDQTLWLYPGTGNGGFGAGVQIGQGWGPYTIVG
jgi:murein DD-endopeptidase MepM/ murein hydrolase activator NlpD